MVRTFHYIEKPATATSSRTATAFDQMRRLQNDRAPVFYLLTSPLLGGLIDDVNSTLARLVEDQTSGFIPFPMKRHRRFYCTATPSLSAPYAVPMSLASLTRQKSSNHKRRPIHLPYSVLTGLESALAGIGETISWLDWWLSTVSGFRDALHPSAKANFEKSSHRDRKPSPSLAARQFQPWLTCSSPARIHSWRKYGLQYRQKSCLFCSTPLYHLLRRSSPLHSWIRHSTRLAQPPMMPSPTRTCILPVFQSDQHRATAEPPPPTVRQTRREALC